jgi:predicted DNA-binding transcriptional regulator AlpA
VTDLEGLSTLVRRSVRSLKRDDCAGRIPRPIMIGSSRRWRIAEIHEWVSAGCPNRNEWESRRKG